jgi:exodeoxyribonuclease V alpha subunit
VDAREPTDPAARELGIEVMAVRWAAPDGGFAVLDAVTTEGDPVTLTGPLGHLHEGETADVGGVFRRHAKHGWQFHADQVRAREPVSDTALLAYLGSVKHIGLAGARFLLRRHGPEVLGIIDRDPGGRLREVPGIGARKLKAAVKSWEEQGALRAVRLFLSEHGVPAAVAARVYRAYGAGTIELLGRDPYAMTELEGIGFATADALARALGTPADAPGRLDAGILHALHEAESDGHCHLPRAELVTRARRLLGADPEDRIDILEASGRVAVEEDRVSDARLDAIERRLARTARELLDDEPALRVASTPRPTEGEFVPTKAQWAVVKQVLARRLSILTGGPGVGKSASMRALVDLLRGERRTVKLCAPTGKAARRLGELTGAEATTIHRLLEYVPGEGFARDAGDPIQGADVLIVDEASMLSVRLADALLQAVGPRTHVLLVGDVDQLAPVGPGRVLEDLLDSGEVPSVRLTEIFRQAARSMIIRAAHAVNRGEYPPTVPAEGDVRDFFVVARESAAAIFDEVCDLAARRLPSHYGLDAVADVQVLAPMHKGPVGVDAFNTELRARLNPDGAAVPGTPFRLQDRLMQLKNNHERKFFNGEIGVLVSHDREEETVILACDDGRRLTLDVSELATLRLAHAASVHKLQGSSARAIVMPVFSGHQMMLTRNLVYTGISRGESVVVLVGQPGALAGALGRRDAQRRYTRLAQRVAPGASG